MAPPAGALRGSLPWKGCLAQPSGIPAEIDQSRQLEIRPEQEQALLPSSPEKGHSGGRDPRTLNGFPYRKDFPDSLCLVFKVLGSIQEYLQVCSQKGFILRGQRIHVRGGSWGVSFPAVFQDFFQGHPWTIPSSFPSCQGYAPEGTVQGDLSPSHGAPGSMPAAERAQADLCA